MKKNGFTLIELLAVIVILAIIALIATPLVLKYIEKSRQESKVDSAYSFVRNLETEIANFSIKNNGKKYNKAPIGGDYYEFKDFDTDKDIDTTVKGDKPDTIKVCLSSLGQIEKAMFKYSNYYVSYDGKKGSISDKTTYNSFSCKTVAGGGTGSDITSEEIFTTNVTIGEVVNGSDTVYRGTITDIELFDYDEKYYYNLYVDDVAEKGLFVWLELGGANYTMLAGTKKYSYMEYGGQMMLAGIDSSTVGPHTVRLEKTSEEVYPHAVKVGTFAKSSRIFVVSRELKNVDTTVVVKDADGNIIKEDLLNANTEDIQPGLYLTFIIYSSEAVELVQQGKTFTVELTQSIEGNNVTTVLGGTDFKTSAYEGTGCELDDGYYYWGNEFLPSQINGC